MRSKAGVPVGAKSIFARPEFVYRSTMFWADMESAPT